MTRFYKSLAVAGKGVAGRVLGHSYKPSISRSIRSKTMNSSQGPVQNSSPTKVKLALCQLLVSADKAKNIELARQAVKEAATNGAELVVLPEMWNCPYSNDSFPTYAENIDEGSSDSFKLMEEAALENKVTLVGGSIPERSDGRLYNTCCVFSHEGKLLAKHRKIHLFDIDIPGKMTFKESLTLTRGDSMTVVDTAAGRLGIGICYDIRFPELAMIYASKGVQLIVYPGAFNMVTGPAHWELLMRSRAMDNQLFVAGCGPARNPDSGFTAWGHSMVAGPFAEVLAATQEQPGIVYADLDYNQISEGRTNMPFREQKRPDLYAVVDKTLA